MGCCGVCVQIDLLFARYPFDRRAEDSKPRVSQIMRDERVQAALHAALSDPSPKPAAAESDSSVAAADN